MFTSDDLIEKFHHFLHNLIATSIVLIKYLPKDFYFHTNINNANSSNIDEQINAQHLNDNNADDMTNLECNSEDENCNLIEARRWTLETKEKLFISLVKIFSLNMPLYVTYKHLLFNHGRYARVKECSCSKLASDSLQLFPNYCQTNNRYNNHSNPSSQVC